MGERKTLPDKVFRNLPGLFHYQMSYPSSFAHPGGPVAAGPPGLLFVFCDRKQTAYNDPIPRTRGGPA